MSNILVFIPAYNCENQILRVLSQFTGAESYFKEILVLDNLSQDNTIQAAQDALTKLQLKIPVNIACNHENYGLGGSHKAAFDYAIKKQFEYCVVLHGDDQGSIWDLIPLLNKKLHHRHDCLLGARFMTGSQLQGYSWFRTFGNQVFNRLFSLAAGRKLYDLGSGLNLYRVDKLRTFEFKKFSNNLTFNYYMILATTFLKWNIHFFPITWREDDQISNVKLFKQSIQVVEILLTFIFKKKLFFKNNHSGRKTENYSFSKK